MTGKCFIMEFRKQIKVDISVSIDIFIDVVVDRYFSFRFLM